MHITNWFTNLRWVWILRGEGTPNTHNDSTLQYVRWLSIKGIEIVIEMAVKPIIPVLRLISWLIFDIFCRHITTDIREKSKYIISSRKLFDNWYAMKTWFYVWEGLPLSLLEKVKVWCFEGSVVHNIDTDLWTDRRVKYFLMFEEMKNLFLDNTSKGLITGFGNKYFMYFLIITENWNQFSKTNFA